MNYVDSLAEEYPNIVTVETYGTSTEGRDLKVVKVGKRSTQPKPAFFLDGGKTR